MPLQYAALGALIYILLAFSGALARAVREPSAPEPMGWWRGRSPDGRLCPHPRLHTNAHAACRCAAREFGGESGVGALFQRLDERV